MTRSLSNIDTPPLSSLERAKGDPRLDEVCDSETHKARDEQTAARVRVDAKRLALGGVQDKVNKLLDGISHCSG